MYHRALPKTNLFRVCTYHRAPPHGYLQYSGLFRFIQIKVRFVEKKMLYGVLNYSMQRKSSYKLTNLRYIVLHNKCIICRILYISFLNADNPPCAFQLLCFTSSISYRAHHNDATMRSFPVIVIPLRTKRSDPKKTKRRWFLNGSHPAHSRALPDDEQGPVSHTGISDVKKSALSSPIFGKDGKIFVINQSPSKIILQARDQPTFITILIFYVHARLYILSAALCISIVLTKKFRQDLKQHILRNGTSHPLRLMMDIAGYQKSNMRLSLARWDRLISTPPPVLVSYATCCLVGAIKTWHAQVPFCFNWVAKTASHVLETRRESYLVFEQECLWHILETFHIQEYNSCWCGIKRILRLGDCITCDGVKVEETGAK